MHILNALHYLILHNDGFQSELLLGGACIKIFVGTIIIF